MKQEERKEIIWFWNSEEKNIPIEFIAPTNRTKPIYEFIIIIWSILPNGFDKL